MIYEEAIASAEKEYDVGGASDWFKFSEGDNKMRVLAEPALLAEKFKLGVVYGKDRGYPYNDEDEGVPNTSVRWLTWIIDRKDNKVKLMKVPHTVFKQISAYQKQEDYAFSEHPMPYDINVAAVKAGQKEVEYAVMAARNNTGLTDAEFETYKKVAKITPKEIVEKMKDKAIKEHQRKGIWLSPEQREENERKRVEEFDQWAEEKRQNPEKIDVIEYPEEELGEPQF